MKQKKHNNQSKTVTLRDVAEEAGVHLSTVSRVLNPTQRKMVSDNVAQRVQKIAKEMGYRTNPFAYGLRTKKSNTIGVVIPDLANPIFPPIIRGIENTLRQAGHTAIFADTDEDTDEENVIVGRILARQVEGMIMATAHRKHGTSAAALPQDIPVVLVNRNTQDKAILSVTNDDFLGAKLAVEHLIKLGHKNIAHLAGPQFLTTGFQRKKGYHAALKKHGLKPNKNLIVSCDAFGFDDGKSGFETLLKRDTPFTAIFAANDFLALGCYHKMKQHNISCPEDVSIVGYNDMPFSDMFQPALTTIRIDLYKMGNYAAELLLKILDGKQDELQSKTLIPELIERESTAPLV